MKITPLTLPEVLLIEPAIFGDERGFFFESFNQQQFDQAVGKPITFVQDNHSRSIKNVLRGLHYQIQHSQGKLVRVIEGEVLDVAVDIRKNSPTFGQWVTQVLSASNKKQLWVPPNFAHGFIVLSESAQFLYKTTDYWYPEFERSILWNDPTLKIEWSVNTPILSAKDQQGAWLTQAELPH